MVSAPIFHVNGDDAEACVRVARLAFEYRQRWHKDVVIDMVCYRRHGHNEGDDPSYTQPEMYRRIDAKRTVRKIYTEQLVKRGDISIEEAEEALTDFQNRLQTALDETKQAAPPSGTRAQAAPPALGVLPHTETGIPRETFDAVIDALDHTPEGFTVHPKLAKQFETRSAMVRTDGEVDWATGEALAFGSLLARGHLGPPRRRGQPPRHLLAAPRGARRLRHRRRAHPPRPARPRRRPLLAATTRCSRSSRPSASSTATRSRTRTRS